jgi:hypothetical protein
MLYFTQYVTCRWILTAQIIINFKLPCSGNNKTLTSEPLALVLECILISHVVHVAYYCSKTS